mmetsp:Transcript_54475/g.119437  ORF Transcript_54475/g.119437 Transcript_54475/m.119437 type:complete len:217 (-) Transcript_54475:57-707(-)
MPESNGLLKVLHGLAAARELLLHVRLEPSSARGVVEEKLHHNAHARTRQEERGQNVGGLFRAKQRAHEPIGQVRHPLHVRQKHPSQASLCELSQRSLENADNGVEGCQIEIDLCVPHVVLQGHGHQTHQSAEEHLGSLCVVDVVWGGVVDLRGELPVIDGGVGLPVQDTEPKHLEGCENGLLEFPRGVAQHVPLVGHVSLRGEVLQRLQHHEVHQG